MTATLAAATALRFSIPDRFARLFSQARRHTECFSPVLLAIHARWYTDEFGEARAERAERREPHLYAHLGDAQVASSQQSHRPLDSPRHEVLVRGFPVRGPELAAKVTSRHVNTAREG